SSEKILVLSTPKLLFEWLCVSRENSAFQQHVASPSLLPVNNEPRRVRWPFVKLPFDDPLWRHLVEVALHWSEHPVHFIFAAGLEQSQEPAFARKFVVVDEGDKVPGRVLDGLVAGQGDILPWLYTVGNGNRRHSREVIHDGLGGF